MKFIADKTVPYLKGILDSLADITYLSSEEFTPEHWTETIIGTELKSQSDSISELNSRIQVEDISADCLTALKGDMTINYAVRRGTHYSIGAIFRNLGGLSSGEIANLKQEYAPAETTAFCAYAFTTGSSHACASGWITKDGSLYFASVGNAVTLAIGIEYDVVS